MTAFAELDTLVRQFSLEAEPWATGGVFAAFATINSIRIFAYVPQILRAWRDTEGAQAVSMATWSIFLVSNLTTIVYALLCLGDLVMALLFSGNTMACLLIVLATWVQRRSHRHRCTVATA